MADRDPGLAATDGPPLRPTDDHSGAEEAAPLPLNRATLAAGLLQDVARRQDGLRVLSDAELAASLAATLAAQPCGGAVATAKGCDLWLFGYGSLIWNPAFHHEDRCLARVFGWRRRFCLSTTLGRGSPQTPGLVLALDYGGACCGVAYRIAAERVGEELPVVWRREMITGAYVPRWGRLHLRTGAVVPGLLFTINHRDSHYRPGLSEEAVARHLAVARGVLGSGADYLFATCEALHREGIADPSLDRIARRVRALQG